MTPIPIPLDLQHTEAAMLTLLDEIEDALRAAHADLRSQAWRDLDSTRCALTAKVREAVA